MTNILHRSPANSPLEDSFKHFEFFILNTNVRGCWVVKCGKRFNLYIYVMHDSCTIIYQITSLKYLKEKYVKIFFPTYLNGEFGTSPTQKQLGVKMSGRLNFHYTRPEFIKKILYEYLGSTLNSWDLSDDSDTMSTLLMFVFNH